MSVRTIIVGAGAAGSVLAARASENEANQVLLLEAGPDYASGHFPKDLEDGTRNSMTRHDWGYVHRPTSGGSRMVFPRGRVVGGSSSVNTCIALRGQAYDYDEWAALGLPAWSFERCLPAFRRLENDLDFGDRPYHGNAGPIRIRRHRPSELAAFQSTFLEACAELGFPWCEDSNHPDDTGAGPHAMNKIDGVRQSAGRAYLDARVRARANVRIEAETTTERVLFEGTRAVGVTAVRNGRLERIPADRVVLAGGAIGTPAVLLRSGIGPSLELSRLGVRCLVDAPGVGHRLLDHPGYAIFLLPRNEGFARVTDPLIQTVLRYEPSTGRRNEMQIQPGSFVPLGVELPIVSLMSSLGKPTGAGILRFPSLALDAKPVIEQRFLDHPKDLGKAVEAVMLMSDLLATKAMRRVVRPMMPRASGLRDEAAIARWIKSQTASGYHPCGTVPMGPESDPFAVCDETGAVRGTSGLYVADASLMPTIPTANTHLPTLMIGERLGAFLRDGRL